jgi:histidinol-phosphate aminotransferase
MPPEPRRPVLHVPPAVHGALDFAELHRLGIDPDEVLDFSSNTNPYGPSPAVRAALANVPLDRYPDRESLALRAALADFLGVRAGRIVVGNGASELIALVALAFVRPDSYVLIGGPTYGEYERAARLMNGRVITACGSPEDNFAPYPNHIAYDLANMGAGLVFLCSPNNPTGAIFPVDALARLARRHPEALFVVDEAYQPFAARHDSALDLAADNVLVLRSMTKDFGLAGVRLGYAIGPEPIVEALRRVRPPWSVSTLAQAAGVAALGDLAHRDRTLALLHEAKDSLVAGLVRLGLSPLPSAVPFFLVPVRSGASFRSALLRYGILVRDCASFAGALPELVPMSQYVRISTRRPEENERLLAAVREVWHR